MTADDKSDLRAQMRRVRAKAHAAGTGRAPASLLDKAVGQARSVAGYWPIGTEIDPRPAMQLLHARGVTLSLPVVVAKGLPLVFRCWSPGDAMVAGAYGIAVPAAQTLTQPHTLIVPLLAFDRHGWRLGYGGGFYDRTLAALRPHGVRAIGLAYAAQAVAAVPRTVDDQRLDLVVTEDEIIDTGSRAACG